MPDKPRVWIAKLGVTQSDLAPDSKRVALLAPVGTAEAPKQEHEVVFLETSSTSCAASCQQVNDPGLKRVKSRIVPDTECENRRGSGLLHLERRGCVRRAVVKPLETSSQAWSLRNIR